MKKIYTILILSLIFCFTMSAKKYKVIERPTTGWRNTEAVEINRIESSDTATVFFLDIFMYPGESFTFAKDTYIQANGKKYAMKGAEGFTPGKYTAISDSGRTTVRLTFPPIDKKAKQCDLMEGTDDRSWKVFNIDLTGKRQPEEVPAGLPDDLKNIKIDHDAPLPEPVLEVGTTTVRVHLLDYRPEMGKEMNMYVNDFVPYGQRELTANISDEGIAEFVFTQYGTAEAFAVLNSRTCGGAAWLKPGETADIYSDPMADIQIYKEEHYNIKSSKERPRGYHRGFYANLNNAYQRSDAFYGLDLNTGMFADYGMTADEYVAHVQSLYEKEKATLNADKSLPRMLRERFSIRLNVMVAEALLNSQFFMEHNYRHVHNQWDRSQPLNYKAPQLREEHFAMLKTLGLDSPQTMYAGNRLASLIDKNAKNARNAIDHISNAALISADTCSFVREVAKISPYMSDIKNMKFLTKEQENELSSLTHPFLSEVCYSLQKEVKTSVEEAKNKTGYMICDIPDVADNEFFDAIAARYQGKVVLVDFWATWCGPCRAAIKEMEPMKDDQLNDKDLAFVYLTGESSPEAAWRTMIADIRGHHYRMSKSQWKSVCDKFGIAYIPSYVLIQKDGTYSLFKDMEDHNKAVSIIREALAK